MTKKQTQKPNSTKHHTKSPKHSSKPTEYNSKSSKHNSKHTKPSPNLTKRTLHYYFLMLKKYKWHALLCLITTPLVIFIKSILIPLVFANMIGQISAGTPPEQLAELLLPSGITLLAAYCFQNFILDELRLWSCWKMEILAMYDLGNLAFDTICSQSMQFHNDRFSGSLVSQAGRFVSSFERLWDIFIWDILPWTVAVISYVVVLLPRAPLFAVCLLVCIVAYTLVAGLTARKMGVLNEKEAAASSKQTGQLADSITNIISVKSYAHEVYEKKRYAKFQDTWQKSSLRTMRYTIKRDFGFSLANIALVAFILLFMIQGQSWFGISVSTLILILTYSQEVLSSLWSVNGIFKGVMRAFGDAREMTEILDLPDDVVDADNAYDMELKDDGVEFSHISFRHADAKEPIFEDFNLSVKPGERIGLVGISGSGKTTLTKLLLRFADVEDGEIRVGGHDIKKITQHSLRKSIAYVPQETALFHRSIADNIAYARPDASRKEIVRAAKLGGADEFIRETPDDYDTLVGERGIKLSGGQRQRIAIARAILKDAPILVLDEATSALDSESEQHIQAALKELMQGRTSIVIAHRLSTVAALDRIIVLDHGRIVEQGSHQELLKAGGAYARLWSRQSGAFMEES